VIVGVGLTRDQPFLLELVHDYRRVGRVEALGPSDVTQRHWPESKTEQDLGPAGARPKAQGVAKFAPTAVALDERMKE